jgi:hypothetical protein
MAVYVIRDERSEPKANLDTIYAMDFFTFDTIFNKRFYERAVHSIREEALDNYYF